LPLAGDNLLPRTLVVIRHRPVLNHKHRGNDNNRTHTDRSDRELLLQRKQVRWKKQKTRWRTTNDRRRKQVRWKKQKTRWRTTNDRRRLQVRSSRLGALQAVASTNTTSDQRRRGSRARRLLLTGPPPHDQWQGGAAPVF
jgi:hypothetical protein